MKNWKKIAAILLAGTLLTACGSSASSQQDAAASAAQSEEEAASAAEEAEAPAEEAAEETEAPAEEAVEEATETAEVAALEVEGLAELAADIPALAETVHLNIGATPGVLHDFPTYFTYKSGLLESKGIEAEVNYYGNGPLIVEAMNAGDLDCGGYGLGGLLSGSVQGVADILRIRCDEAILQKFFAKNDSALVAAGRNDETGFYGSADDWKGLEVYCAPGTTLQYVLGEGLNRLGITFDDCNMVFMEAPNITTALHAGQGEVWGLWNMNGFTEDVLSGYTDVLNGQDLGLHLFNGSVASKAALADTTKEEAIFTWLACEDAVINWMNESDDNMQIAAEYYAEWCEEQGIATNGADLLEYMNSVTFLNMDEEYEMFTTTGESGNLLVEEAVSGAMDFFISLGSYTEDDRALLLDGDFNPAFAEKMHNG